MKELRNDTDRKRDYCKKYIYIYIYIYTKRSQLKVENSFAETKAELKAINSKLDNEELVSDLEDRIIEITRLEQQTEIQILKYVYRRPME